MAEAISLVLSRNFSAVQIKPKGVAMKRRQFFQAAGSGLVFSAIAKPAIAQANPEIRWRLASAFPKSLDTLWGGAETFSKYLAEATNGRFQVQLFAPGEIVGAGAGVDAVGNGTVEMGLMGSNSFAGIDPTFALASTTPFGLNTRQQNAWMYQGGGIDLWNEFYAKYNIYALPAGNTGAQMGGFFRKEVKSLEDLRGLKFRIAGLTGQVMSKLGAVPQQIAAGDVYPALERGTIDAAEWVGPYDDEKLGLARVAPYYYYPGFWEGGAMVHLFINKQKWDGLPKDYQSIVQSVAARVNIEMLAKYDAENPAALRRLVAAGAQLRPFSVEIMDAAFRATSELYNEISAKNPTFKKMIDTLLAFRDEEYLWFQVSEYSYDSYMVRARAKASR